MPDSQLEQESQVFASPRKNRILAEAYPEIKGMLDRQLVSYKPRFAQVGPFGATFETLAIYERVLKNPETIEQREVRKIIEDIHHHSQLFLGKLNEPNNPDYVGVIFDKNGQLMINEVVEVKSTETALKRGIDNSQGQKTMDMMVAVVDILNEIISGKDPAEIPPVDEIGPKYARRRQVFLNSIKNKISELGVVNSVTFAPNLKYVIVLLSEEMATDSNFKVAIGNKPIEINIVRSLFSKRDIHYIIDHYAETP